jgi:hypothetical protein
MLKNLSLVVVTVMMTSMTRAQSPEITSIPQIGPHHRLFIYEKNENPQNILVVFAKTNAQCQFQKMEDDVLFDFYWLMDRETYKPTNALIKRGIRERLQVKSVKANSFDILLSDLSQVQTDLPEARLSVEAVQNPDGGCTDIKAFIKLGPSDGNARIQLESIYAEAAKTWNPLSRKLISITLKGTDIKTGQVITHKYTAR